jgi:hypothetical protein
MSINGGGGEILRNFFYLRDARYRPRELLWSFYSQYDPEICTPIFDEESYYRRLEEKISELVGTDMQLLPRAAVEWLYHRLRCRSWDGKVNSDNSRFGHTALPFEEGRLTEMASRIPIRFKNHGALEAMLIERFDRRLAGYASNYGHDFIGPPPLKRKIADYSTMLRPPALRRFMYRLRHKLAAPSGERGPSSDLVAALLPGPLGFAERFFRLDRVSDPRQVNRILSLEYLARKLGTKLHFAID